MTGIPERPDLGDPVDFSDIKPNRLRYPKPPLYFKPKPKIVIDKNRKFIPLDLSTLPRVNSTKINLPNSPVSELRSTSTQKPVIPVKYASITDHKPRLGSQKVLRPSINLKQIPRISRQEQILEIRNNLTPVRRNEESTPQISEFKRILRQRRNLINYDRNRVLKCETCEFSQDWPIHCFHGMVKENDFFKCVNCGYQYNLAHTCDGKITEQMEQNPLKQIIRLGKSRKSQYDYAYAIQLFQTAIKYIEEVDDPNNRVLKMEVRLELAYCYMESNQPQDARYELLEVYDSVNDNIDPVELKIQAGLYLCELKLKIGKLERVEEYIISLRPYFNRVSDNILHSRFHLISGMHCRLKGNYPHSLQHLQLAKKYSMDTTGNEVDLSKILLQLGITSEGLGDYAATMEYFQAAIENLSEDEYLTATHLYYQQIKLALEKNDVQLARERFDDMKMVYLNHKNNPEIVTRYKLADALILKHSPRMIEKGKSLEAFKDMLATRQYQNFEQHIFIMVNIADLLLQELKAFDSQEAFNELEGLIRRLKTISKEEGSTSIYVQSSMLQAKLKLVQSQYDSAFQLLEELENYTINHELYNEKQQISRLKEDIADAMNKVDQVSFQNQSLKERMQQSNIDLYIQMAKNFIKND